MTPGWIRGPVWDSFFILAGLWAPLALLTWGLIIGSPTSVNFVFLGITYAFIGVIHRWGPLFTIYFTPLLAEEIKSERKTFIHIPVIITVVTITLGLIISNPFAILGSLSYLSVWSFLILLNVFIYWELYHFSSQDFGVLSLYRNRSGQNKLSERTFDRRFALAQICFFLPIAFWDQLELFRRKTRLFLQLFTSEEFSQAFHMVTLVLMLASAAFTLFAIYTDYKKKNRSLPKMLYYLNIGVTPLIAFFSIQTAVAYFTAAYVINHWLVAISLNARVNTGVYLKKGENSYFSAVSQFVIKFLLVLSIVVLFRTNTVHWEIINTFPPPNSMVGSTGGLTSILRGLVFGISFSTNFLHFYLDGRLYRFRDRNIRTKVGPLIL